MKKQKFLVFVIGIIILTSCNKKNPTETQPKITHPQANIPWASLADSPWPMYHHDPQSTGRSQYKGPRQGIIKWKFEPDSTALIWPAIIIGSDSTVYFSTQNEKTQYGTSSFLYAVYPDGTLKWKYQFEDTQTSDFAPLIAADGTIFIGTTGITDYLNAIDPNGTLKWRRKINVASQINIGLDGTLYFRGGDGYLYAVSQDGAILWNIKEGYGFYYYGCSFSPDGSTIYLFSMTNQHDISALCAVNTSGILLWKYNLQDSLPNNNSLPLVGSNGNIYFGVESIPLSNSKFYSISSKGQLNWFFKCEGGAVGGEEPTIDRDGNLYILSWDSSFSIVSIDYGGNFRWQIKEQLFPYAGYVCDNEGVLYVFQSDITAYKSNGEILWQLNLDGSFNRIAAPAIGLDGTLYVGTYGDTNKLYAIH